MNKLNSLQRKLVYLGGIILLIIPITLLGRPGRAGRVADPIKGLPAIPSEEGGKLDQLRAEYDLGEVELGAVDPSSATMNLVLLGLRGVATNLLWMDAKAQQEHKNWTELERTTESIILLQPHFTKVWVFQGWNLAYNVSAEWDAVEDRYFWVKKGIKFYQRGTKRNRTQPELYWYTADLFGKKIGRSDEWVQFRRFFKNDPDPRFEDDNGLDREVNPEGLDNYLVSKAWYQLSKDVDDEDKSDRQHIMANSIFRSYPARSQIDYAEAFGREGSFGETSREAWDQAFQDWTAFGMEPIPIAVNDIRLDIRLEMRDEGDYAELAEKTGLPVELLKNEVSNYQNMNNYRYWRTRALAEREKNTVDAHRLLYEGEQKFNSGEFETAEKLLLEGMRKYEAMLKEYPVFLNDDITIENGLIAVLIYRDVRQILGLPQEIHPLKQLWNNFQNRIPLAEEERTRRANQLG